MNKLIGQRNPVGKMMFFVGIAVIAILLVLSIIELMSKYSSFESVIVLGIQFCFGFILIGLSEVIRLIDSSDPKTEEEAFVGGKFAQ